MNAALNGLAAANGAPLPYPAIPASQPSSQQPPASQPAPQQAQPGPAQPPVQQVAVQQVAPITQPPPQFIHMVQDAAQQEVLQSISALRAQIGQMQSGNRGDKDSSATLAAALAACTRDYGKRDIRLIAGLRCIMVEMLFNIFENTHDLSFDACTRDIDFHCNQIFESIIARDQGRGQDATAAIQLSIQRFADNDTKKQTNLSQIFNPNLQGGIGVSSYGYPSSASSSWNGPSRNTRPARREYGGRDYVAARSGDSRSYETMDVDREREQPRS